MEIAFSAERSIQDAIQELSEGEFSTVLISYSVMFLYVALALGNFKSFKTLLVSVKIEIRCMKYQKLMIRFHVFFQVHSKIMLAYGGIVIVVSSIICSLGALGYARYSTTMLVIEVIPFLVLAVGVDNLFILVHAYQRLDIAKYMSSSEAVAEALGEVGPSILLTAISQASCFGIGSITSMPAVRTFALYAAVAITFNFFLQITAFIALMTIDLVRQNVSNEKLIRDLF